MYHNNIVGMLKTHWCCDMLHNASLRTTQTVLEVVGTENRVTSCLAILLDSSSIAEMQSKSLVTDSRLLFFVK